jgi:hypothetical protein
LCVDDAKEQFNKEIHTMQRTLTGRIVLLRGLRHQVEIYLHRLEDLRPWWPIVGPVLLFVFVRAYNQERERMRVERVQPLKDEKALLEKVEHQTVYEAQRKKKRWFGRLRGS